MHVCVRLKLMLRTQALMACARSGFGLAIHCVFGRRTWTWHAWCSRTAGRCSTVFLAAGRGRGTHGAQGQQGTVRRPGVGAAQSHHADRAPATEVSALCAWLVGAMQGAGQGGAPLPGTKHCVSMLELRCKFVGCVRAHLHAVQQGLDLLHMICVSHIVATQKW